MPRGSEYSDEKRAAALIMYLIHKASHSDVEAKTGVSKSAIRQLSSRAHKAGVDRTSIEELIVFARTKPRKGRPRRDATKTDKAAESETRQEGGMTKVLECDTAAANAEPRDSAIRATAAPDPKMAGGEDLLEMIKSWEQRKAQAFDAAHTATAKEQA
ncbi:unnamed protein product [Aureobasidium mustum]|uniref:Uncharacterized protein n=1 Tax=Aureobasidium mustum TaxID=2773714 RepID=A0A9N8K788_9PEZI|nr:unnamed protein product [Aureobasidium mustum]